MKQPHSALTQHIRITSDLPSVSVQQSQNGCDFVELSLEALLSEGVFLHPAVYVRWDTTAELLKHQRLQSVRGKGCGFISTAFEKTVPENTRMLMLSLL